MLINFNPNISRNNKFKSQSFKAYPMALSNRRFMLPRKIRLDHVATTRSAHVVADVLLEIPKTSEAEEALEFSIQRCLSDGQKHVADILTNAQKDWKK